MSALRQLWSLRKRRPYFVGTALFVLAVLLVYPAIDWWLRANGIAPPFSFWDFGAYGGAVSRWLSGEPVYVTNESGGYHGTYLYPPIALLLFAPFSIPLTFYSAALTWELVSVLLLWTGVSRVAARCGADLAWWEQLGIGWLLLGFQPLLLSLKMGQTAAFLTALLCFAFLFADTEGPVQRATGAVSGVLTGIVGLVKLAYAPVGAHLLRRRERFLGAVASGIALVAISVSIFGLETNWQYLEVLAWGFEQGSSARSPTLWGPPYYRPLFWLPEPQALRIGGSLAIVAGVLLADETVDRESFALGVAAVPLIAPQTYVYYLVAAIPATIVLLAVELNRGESGYPIVPLVAVLLLQVHAYGLKFLVDVLPVMYPPAKALLSSSAMLQPALWGNLLLVGIAGYRVAASATDPVVSRS